MGSRPGHLPDDQIDIERMVVIRFVAEHFAGFCVVVLHQIGLVQILMPEMLPAVLAQQPGEALVISVSKASALQSNGFQRDGSGVGPRWPRPHAAVSSLEEMAFPAALGPVGPALP